MMLKKLVSITVTVAVLSLQLCSCHATDDITVITREDGSGTRAAFAELIGAKQLYPSGAVSDSISEHAEVTHSTAVVLASVEQNEGAVGYISLCSYSDSVKALRVDGALPSADTVKSGAYKLARRLYLASLSEPDGVCADFLSFIMSRGGQEIAEKLGYVGCGYIAEYTPTDISGRMRISGSSSVAPLIERMAEEYRRLNPAVELEIQQSDSSSGISSVISGISDMCMISREPSAQERERGIIPYVVALDAITVIVNRSNRISSVSTEQLRAMYSGEIRRWSELEAYIGDGHDA